jgi:hypothetical protein
MIVLWWKYKLRAVEASLPGVSYCGHHQLEYSICIIASVTPYTNAKASQITSIQ